MKYRSDSVKKVIRWMCFAKIVIAILSGLEFVFLFRGVYLLSLREEGENINLFSIFVPIGLPFLGIAIFILASKLYWCRWPWEEIGEYYPWYNDKEEVRANFDIEAH